MSGLRLLSIAVFFLSQVVLGQETIKEFSAHEGEITNICISPDGNTFLTAGVDSRVNLWDDMINLFRQLREHYSNTESKNLVSPNQNHATS